MTFNEHELRAMASTLRQQADRILDDLKGVIDLADQIDEAAAGRLGEAELQAAVDRLNAHLAEVWQ